MKNTLKTKKSHSLSPVSSAISLDCSWSSFRSEIAVNILWWWMPRPHPPGLLDPSSPLSPNHFPPLSPSLPKLPWSKSVSKPLSSHLNPKLSAEEVLAEAPLKNCEISVENHKTVIVVLLSGVPTTGFPLGRLNYWSLLGWLSYCPFPETTAYE